MTGVVAAEEDEDAPDDDMDDENDADVEGTVSDEADSMFPLTDTDPPDPVAARPAAPNAPRKAPPCGDSADPVRPVYDGWCIASDDASLLPYAG